jgi:tRNA (mo5U34)-methyltransferase
VAVSDIQQAIDATRWYHVLELPDGRLTPGEFDLRSTVAKVPLPESLTGKRCLDVGTRDGFWAFEMERRGAAEVIGIDLADIRRLDWPLPMRTITDEEVAALARSEKSFDVAKRALGSNVERRELSVYDLDPEDAGEFDFAFVGTLLMHLRDPIGALMAVRRVMRPGGTLIVNEAVSISLSAFKRTSPAASLFTIDGPFWWLPNRDGLRRYVEAAGFRTERIGRPYLVDRGPTLEVPKLRLRSPGGGLAKQLLMRAGLPHVWVVATPATRA